MLNMLRYTSQEKHFAEQGNLKIFFTTYIIPILSSVWIRKYVKYMKHVSLLQQMKM